MPYLSKTSYLQKGVKQSNYIFTKYYYFIRNAHSEEKIIFGSVCVCIRISDQVRSSRIVRPAKMLNYNSNLMRILRQDKIVTVN